MPDHQILSHYLHLDQYQLLMELKLLVLHLDMGNHFDLKKQKKLFLRIIKISSHIKFLSKFSDSLTDSYDVVNNSIKPKIFVISSILSASYWILESIAVYFIFQSFGIDFIELIQVIPTYATSIILGVASFVPGGIGVFEGTLTGLLNLQGLTLSTAVTLTIFIRIFTIWYSVIVGFFALKLAGAFSYKV